MCYVGLTLFCEIFLTFSMNDEIICRIILSVPHNIVMDLNNVMDNYNEFKFYNSRVHNVFGL